MGQRYHRPATGVEGAPDPCPVRTGATENTMKTFHLYRHEDESGVSGTGRVAQGVVFDDGQAVLRWLGEHPSTTVYPNIGEVKAIHGHQGKTEVVMDADYRGALGEVLKAANTNLADLLLEKVGDSKVRKILEERDILT
jgi:hypothetical protein